MTQAPPLVAAPPLMVAPPWVEAGIRITRQALDAIEEDALRGYAADEEACGYVVGPAADGLLCDEATRMENVANKLHRLDPQTHFRTARQYFAFNERKFEKAIEAGRAAERPVKVLYHSHLDAGAYFSRTDRAVMSMGEAPTVEGGEIALGPGPAWPLAFLVISAVAAGVDDRKLYAWDGTDFAERELVVV